MNTFKRVGETGYSEKHGISLYTQQREVKLIAYLKLVVQTLNKNFNGP